MPPAFPAAFPSRSPKSAFVNCKFSDGEAGELRPSSASGSRDLGTGLVTCVAMAMIISANLVTTALNPLLQSFFPCPCEPTSSSLVVPSRKPKSLGALGNDNTHSKVANERIKGFSVATRATVTGYRDVDSVRIKTANLLSDCNACQLDFILLFRLVSRLWTFEGDNGNYFFRTQEPSRHEEKETSSSELLCCPICFKPLRRDGSTGLTR